MTQPAARRKSHSRTGSGGVIPPTRLAHRAALCHRLAPKWSEPAVPPPAEDRPRLLTRLRQAASLPDDPHLRAALAEEQRIGQRIAATARSATVVLLIVLVPVFNRDPVMVFSLALLGGLLATDLLRRRLARRGLGMRGSRNAGRFEVPLMAVDLILVLFLTVLPNPFTSEKMPSAISYLTGKFSIFYILLALAMLAYSWRTILTVGLMMSGTWLAAALVIAAIGHQNADIAAALQPVFAAYPRLQGLIDPNAVQMGQRLQEVVAFLIVATILALKSWRSEQLIVRQAQLAEERANLSRYFSPNMVDVLASRSHDIGRVQTVEIGVMFVDIVGFTKLAETLTPQATVDILRKYYAVIETAVFDNGGTLDKYLGDGVMATFGTPQPGPDDARGALRAARRIIAVTDTMNAALPATAARIGVSVGVHFGTVILGDVGPMRRLEFAVLGDTVNVASRLEAATRELGCRILCSDALMQRVGQDWSVAGFTPRSALTLRGRAMPIDVWTFGAAPVTAG